MIESFTHIVVGAGSAGSVLAAGIARRGNTRVLLIEAGPSYASINLPPELANGFTPAIGSHDWGLRVHSGDRGARDLPRGRVMGGTSQINSCIALWPEESDFAPDELPWSFVEGALKSNESDPGGGNAHGKTGPLPILRRHASELSEVSTAFIDGCEAMGLRLVDDISRPACDAVGIAPLNLTRSGRRVSSVDAFLRGLPDGSLCVVSDTLVEGILISGSQAKGVWCRDARTGATRTFEAHTTILAAGAIGTPLLLLRSGVGPAETLELQSIRVKADLPGVGTGFSDHSQVPLVFQSEKVDPRSTPCVEALGRYTSSAGHEERDMQLCLIGHVELPNYRPDLAARWDANTASVLTANLMTSDVTGTVVLDRNRGPLIEYDYAAGKTDAARLREGVRLASDLLYTQSLVNDDQEVAAPPRDRMDDNEMLDKWIAEHLQVGHHPMGTARMGSTSARLTVVDSSFAVQGIRHLFVADASLKSGRLRANTNLTAMALATAAAGVIE